MAYLPDDSEVDLELVNLQKIREDLSECIDEDFNYVCCKLIECSIKVNEENIVIFRIETDE